MRAGDRGARIGVAAGSAALAVLIACGVGGAMWWRHRAEARAEAERLRLDAAVCRRLSSISLEIEEAARREVNAYSGERWAPPVLRGEAVPGDAREPLLAVGAAFDGSEGFALVRRVLGDVHTPRPTFGDSPSPPPSVVRPRAAEVEAARACTRRTFITGIADPDARTFRGDYPYNLAVLEALMLVEAQGRPPLECMQEVLDAVRFAQLTRFVDHAPLTPEHARAGLVRALAFDACAARASASELAAITPELRSLVEHPIDLGIVWRLNLVDDEDDGRPHVTNWSPGEPEWLMCGNQAPPAVYEHSLRRLDAMRSLEGCSIATLPACEARLLAIGRVGAASSGSAALRPLLHVADEETWTRVIALAASMRRARAEGAADPAPEAWAVDPRSGRPLAEVRADGVHLSFPGAAGELVLPPASD